MNDSPPRPQRRLRRIRVRSLSVRDLLVLGLPALLLLGAAFWLASRFIEPAPPGSLVIGTGSEEGAYHAYALRYRDILRRDGVELVLRSSGGSVENLERLADPDSDVEVAFVQSGLRAPDGETELVSLGGVHLEPVWVFYTGRARIEHLTRLRGHRLAIGPPGSGTRALALQLLRANGLDPARMRLSDLEGEAASVALRTGRIDAVFAIAAPEAPVVGELLRTPGVRLMSFAQADAYARRFQFLTRVVLPEGAVDLMRNLPPRDVELLAPTAQLIARPTLHPALQTLLLRAAAEVHGGAGLLQNAGDFPSPRRQDFPLSREAERYHAGGLPILHRVLPFWLAVLFERLWVMLLPVVAIAFPLYRILPPLYNWRIRNRILELYGRLKFLEFDIRHRYDPARVADYERQLDEIDELARTRPIPLAFTDQVYLLRSHVGIVRGTLAGMRAGVPPAADTGAS